jgi:hypothetical protein
MIFLYLSFWQFVALIVGIDIGARIFEAILTSVIRRFRRHCG